LAQVANEVAKLVVIYAYLPTYALTALFLLLTVVIYTNAAEWAAAIVVLTSFKLIDACTILASLQRACIVVVAIFIART